MITNYFIPPVHKQMRKAQLAGIELFVAKEEYMNARLFDSAIRARKDEKEDDIFNESLARLGGFIC